MPIRNGLCFIPEMPTKLHRPSTFNLRSFFVIVVFFRIAEWTSTQIHFNAYTIFGPILFFNRHCCNVAKALKKATAHLFDATTHFNRCKVKQKTIQIVRCNYLCNMKINSVSQRFDKCYSFAWNVFLFHRFALRFATCMRNEKKKRKEKKKKT